MCHLMQLQGKVSPWLLLISISKANMNNKLLKVLSLKIKNELKSSRPGNVRIKKGLDINILSFSTVQ